MKYFNLLEKQVTVYIGCGSPAIRFTSPDKKIGIRARFCQV